MAKKPGRPKEAGLGLQQGTGQYRKIINGRPLYFGTDPDEAVTRYQLYLETGLLWKRGYRQFCLERDGKAIPMGATIEATRRNYAAYQARAATVERMSVRNVEFVVNTVREVGDAYLAWLIRNQKSSQHVYHTKQHFRELLALQDCGNLPLEKLSIGYFKNWYNHCRQHVEREKKQANWANRRMATVKAAFLRCQKEGWLGVCMTDLHQIVGVLQQHGGPQLEQEIFTPAELRAVLKAADTPDRLAILVGINCAVGNADIGRLRWGDCVQRTAGGRTEYIFAQARGKTKRRRRTPLWALTVQGLERWRGECGRRGTATDSDSPVFVTRRGTLIVNSGVGKDGSTWRNDALSCRLAKLLKTVGIQRERLAWYSLRHTAATWATDYAEDHSLVGEGNQFLLGQASDAMWKTYSKGVPPAVRKAVDAIWRGLNDGEELVLIWADEKAVDSPPEEKPGTLDGGNPAPDEDSQ